MCGNLGCCAPPNSPTSVIILITYYLLLITCCRDFLSINREKSIAKMVNKRNFALRKSKTCTALRATSTIF